VIEGIGTEKALEKKELNAEYDVKALRARSRRRFRR